ncbi:MAG: glycosyltransferase family 8 protein [Acidimicrobiales bacterium]
MFAVDDNYAVGAAVAGRSIRMNLLDDTACLRFHVIDGGLSVDVRSSLIDALSRLGETQTYIVQDGLVLGDCWRAASRSGGHYTSAILARLHLSEVLPDDVERVVYLDADTLVLDDLAQLYALDLGSAGMGAVINQGSETRCLVIDESAREYPYGAQPPGYFNSGVLIIDMNKWRADEVTQQALWLYRRFGLKLHSPDQDILNIIFAGRWRSLPAKWNKMIEVHKKYDEHRTSYLTRREGIVHYVGRVKPWHREFPHRSLLDLYLEYWPAGGPL